MPDQHQGQDANQGKANKRPVGNGSAKKSPVHGRAVPAAFENHGNGAVDRKIFNHAVKVTPASGNFRRIPLQPGLPCGHKSAKTCLEKHQYCTCNLYGFFVTKACQACGNSYRYESITLHNTHRAWIQSLTVLQVQTKGQHEKTCETDQSE